MSAQPRSQSGFTLIELMLVVVIISVLALALAPSVSRTVLEQRSGGAARELVRLVREARLKTLSLRRAHVVYINENQVRILSAVNNHCQMTNWSDVNARCTTNAAGRVAGTECLSVDFDAPPWTLSNSAQVRLQEIVDVAASGANPATEKGEKPLRVVCYAPNGNVYHAKSLDEAFSAANTVGGGFLFQLDMLRPEDQQPVVPARRVLMPLNGNARVLQ